MNSTEWNNSGGWRCVVGLAKNPRKRGKTPGKYFGGDSSCGGTGTKDIVSVDHNGVHVLNSGMSHLRHLELMTGLVWYRSQWCTCAEFLYVSPWASGSHTISQGILLSAIWPVPCPVTSSHAGPLGNNDRVRSSLLRGD